MKTTKKDLEKTIRALKRKMDEAEERSDVQGEGCDRLVSANSRLISENDQLKADNKALTGAIAEKREQSARSEGKFEGAKEGLQMVLNVVADKLG